MTRVFQGVCALFVQTCLSIHLEFLRYYYKTSDRLDHEYDGKLFLFVFMSKRSEGHCSGLTVQSFHRLILKLCEMNR